MTIEKALSRIEWRFTQGKSFLPNEGDAEAYNFIAEFCIKKQGTQLKDNQLFGKLYIFLFKEFLKFYRTDVTDSIPQKELHRILDKKLPLLITEFLDERNQINLERHIEADFPIGKFKKMEYQEVSENFRTLINGALNSFG